MSFVDITIILAAVAIIVSSIFNAIRNKKNGKSSCCGGCGSCSASKKCNEGE